ncbi:MAG: hypothetical protein C00003105_00750 [ANME-2 cluster archaeon HR1]|nr:MAG: hypothetical protein C00003105_00750 [ANME-2 cluster archaeon HR1]
MLRVIHKSPTAPEAFITNGMNIQCAIDGKAAIKPIPTREITTNGAIAITMNWLRVKIVFVVA